MVMKLYVGSTKNPTISRGYSFDHPTATKICIMIAFDFLIEQQKMIPFLDFLVGKDRVNHKTLLVRRDGYPLQLIDVGKDYYTTNTHLDHHMYQFKSCRYITKKYANKIGLVYFYNGVWK